MAYQWIRRVGVVFALTLTTISATRVEAAIIDFDSIANPGPFFYDVGMTYTEDGFTLTVAEGTLPFVTFGSGEVRYGGSAALYNNNGNGLTRLTLDGGGTFSITSIDLAGDTRFGTIPVSFIGTKNDLSTVQFDLTLTNNLLMAFAFPSDFTDLVKLEWRQVTPYHQFDNLVVEANRVAPVPEPATLLLVGAGLSAAFRRRRRNPERGTVQASIGCKA